MVGEHAAHLGGVSFFGFGFYKDCTPDGAGRGAYRRAARGEGE
jgi:hypothetical protein